MEEARGSSRRLVTKAINDRLQIHFGQAKQCAWTNPPLDVTMDFNACCEKAETMLTGTYNTQELDSTTK
jgi:hypothetical protein